jgi:HAD superfamily phosphoserine phosphatase-like hydrolase
MLKTTASPLYSGLSFFDLDHTLITVNSSYCFGSYLHERRFISKLYLYRCLFDYMRHKWFGLSIENLHKKVFKHLFNGCSKDLIEQMAKAFVQERLPSLFYEPAVRRLRAAQKAGHYTIILSSSPDFIVAPLAEILMVDEWQASMYACDKEGFFFPY